MPLRFLGTGTDCSNCLSDVCVSHDRCHVCKAGWKPPECKKGKWQGSVLARTLPKVLGITFIRSITSACHQASSGHSQSPSLYHLCLGCNIHSLTIRFQILSLLSLFLHQECDAGHYGVNCAKRCGDGCPGTCDPVCGVCLEDCKDGWSGDRCDHAVCDTGLMPPACQRSMCKVTCRVDKWKVYHKTSG